MSVHLLAPGDDGDEDSAGHASDAGRAGEVSVARDVRAEAALPVADQQVVAAWQSVRVLASDDPPPMGLLAGERPAADVEVLASMVAAAEYELARRMVLASNAGALPLIGPGGMLRARGWSPGSGRRLTLAGELALGFPVVAAQWAAGVITAEHVAAIARARGRLSDAQLEVALRGFEGRWGVLSPRGIGEVIAAIDAALHPPDDPDPCEIDAYQSRHLDFAISADTVLFTGTLPRLEGEAFMAVIEAFAESLRSAADRVAPGVRRADALQALVEAAAGAGAVPARGGLPVGLTVTLTRTEAGDTVATTSRGHRLTPAEQRFTCCDPAVTPVLIARPEPAYPSPSVGADAADPGAADGGAADGSARILAIAEALLGQRIPLAVGRTSRTATLAQRRALAIRDGGCVIPGCGVPPELCQVHHLEEWAAGGNTDLDNMVLACWVHHRQVDLRMWRIEARRPDPTPPPEPPEEGNRRLGAPWPADHDAPWTITRTPRTRWRL